jgi:hypothetical protein
LEAGICAFTAELVCYENEEDSEPVLQICAVADGTGLGSRDVFALDDLRDTWLVPGRDWPRQLHNTRGCSTRVDSAGFAWGYREPSNRPSDLRCRMLKCLALC